MDTRDTLSAITEVETPRPSDSESTNDNPSLSDATKTEEEPKHDGPSAVRRTTLVVSMFMALFLPALDQTIISTALPRIMYSLGAGSSNEGYTWIGSAYALAQAVVMPFFGQASEAFGRKWTFLAAISIFTVGSCLCGASQSVSMLIASRVIQGAGAGGITALVYILIGDLVGTRKRGKYQGYIGATWAVASALGPVLSGVLAEKVSWRWCFLINLPICLTCIVVNMLFLDISNPTKSLRELLRNFDILGIASISSATILLLLAFEWASQGISWTSPQVMVSLVLAAITFAGFIVAESRAEKPVIPLGFFTHPTRAGAYTAAFFHAMAYMGLNYYLPLFFQGVKGQSASQAGLSMLPLVLAFGIVSTLSGLLITATRRYQELIWASFVLSWIGCGLLIMLNEQTSIALTVILLVIAGVGIAPNFNSLLIPIHASFDDSSENRNISLSASAYAFIRTIGLSMGISVSGLVCFDELRQLDAGSSSQTGISQLIGSMDGMSNPQRAATVRVFESAMRNVFIQVTVVMGIGMWAAFFIRKHQLGEKVRTDHRFGSGQGNTGATTGSGGHSLGRCPR